MGVHVFRTLDHIIQENYLFEPYHAFFGIWKNKYKGYKCHDPVSKRMYTSHHVVFDEKHYPFASSSATNSCEPIVVPTSDNVLLGHVYPPTIQNEHLVAQPTQGNHGMPLLNRSSPANTYQSKVPTSPVNTLSNQSLHASGSCEPNRHDLMLCAPRQQRPSLLVDRLM